MEIRKATLEDAAAISALNATVQDLHAVAHPHIFKPASSGAFSPDDVAAILAEPALLFSSPLLMESRWATST